VMPTTSLTNGGSLREIVQSQPSLWNRRCATLPGFPNDSPPLGENWNIIDHPALGVENPIFDETGPVMSNGH
jgi:hypothetical protein